MSALLARATRATRARRDGRTRRRAGAAADAAEAARSGARRAPVRYTPVPRPRARVKMSLRVARRYDVFFHVNVTDIDDKIILRARQNHVLDVYAAEVGLATAPAAALAPVAAKVADAMALAKAKLDKKSAELAAPLPAATEKRLVEAHETAKKEHSLKCEQFAAKERELAALGGDAAALFAAARSELGALLDKERGNAVTDHAIFDAHARKYEREFCDDMAALGVRPFDALTRVTE